MKNKKNTYLKKISVSYSEALDRLTRWLQTRSLDQVTETNLNAVASHWLHGWWSHPGTPVSIPFIDKKAINKIWRATPEVISQKTVSGHLREITQINLDLDFSGSVPYPPPRKPEFTFIDLFAGIGGFRIAMQKQGGQCVFSSEWDENAKKTYFANFGEVPFGDINQINPQDIPDHDILCGGFPCQPFSLAGVSKKNSLGRKHGFEDKTQGTLFFNIAKIIKEKKPTAFFLENVKNLQRHDGGKTFSVILNTLKNELKYKVNFKVVDGANWVPQHRERIFIIGYNPDKIDIKSENEIVIPEKPINPKYKRKELSEIVNKIAHDKYTLGPGTWDTLERHKAHHAAVGNGFGYGIHSLPIPKGEITRTISARYHKDGAEILIRQDGKRPRRLTVEEAMQLQGYDPEKFIFPVSATQAYHQIGNSVVGPAITEAAKAMIDFMKKHLKKKIR